jgi:uncharacterized protein
MSRPKKCRCVGCSPNAFYFKPKGIPITDLDEVSINLDELEAIKLADCEGLYHEDGAKKMGISRPTFGRILQEARRKIADAIVHGKGLRIETQDQTINSLL